MKINGLISLPLITVAALLGVSTFASAQTILQSSGNFTLLGGTFISNTGATTISGGNVGLYPAATTGITGFFAEDGGPAVITPPGGIIPTGPVTQQAMADLKQAAMGLDGMPATTILSGQDLGGMTLLPGVYTFGVGAAAQNGALTLNASGQNGAVWVFQIGTSLTTGLNAAVTVTNLGTNLGADDGIFWDVGTAVTFGQDNILAGNYLVGTSTTFSSGITGQGRILAQAGITLSGTSLSAQGNSWDNGLMYNNLGDIVPVPEPAAFLWLAPLGALGLAIWRRRDMAKSIVA